MPKEFTEEFKVSGEELLSKVKNLIKELLLVQLV
jgi:hypothetical protein